MLEAMENRISRRTFLNDPFSKTEIHQIQEYLDKLNRESQLTLEFLEDGKEAFSSLRKSYGLFTNVKSLIVMKGKKEDENLREKIGYYGEELVLLLTALGFGTCWVGGTFDKEKIAISGDEQLVCVLVVGKVPNLTLKEKMMRAAVSKRRKPLSERLSSDTESLPPWLIAGIEAVRLAPSAKNSQKPLFVYQKGTLCAKVPNDYEFDLVDLGIAKKHFELATGGLFTLGNGGMFRFDHKSI